MSELAPILMMIINITFGFVIGYLAGAKIDKTNELEAELTGWKTEAANRKWIYEKAKAENERLQNQLDKWDEMVEEHSPRR